jgi:hypothetical protein
VLVRGVGQELGLEPQDALEVEGARVGDLRHGAPVADGLAPAASATS